MQIRLPSPDQHFAMAGMTGSGKTVAGLEMLSLCDHDGIATVIIDHKREDYIMRLQAEPLHVNSLVLPDSGIHVVKAGLKPEDKETLEGLLQRIWNKKNTRIYVDEGHLLGMSHALRQIMVTGRSRRVSVFWTSQKAAWIDPFIWSQASFYRCFRLQTPQDVKRFNENFPIKWKPLDEYMSYYYDLSLNKVHVLKPAVAPEESIRRLGDLLRTHYNRI
jgi:DNA helicase HerA-like ATPase